MSDDHLYRQLVKLGDMMGDGLHYEPDGKWIEKEYRQIVKALGLKRKYGRKKPKDNTAINERMSQRIKDFKCQRCHSQLKQTRSGSMRAKCTKCGTKYQLLSKTKPKTHEDSI